MTPRNIKLLYARDFFIALRFFTAIQIIYFVSITHSYALAMSLFAAVTVSQAVLEIPTGVYSDKIGRKSTIVLGTFFAFLAVSFYAVGLNYWVLFAGAVVEGLARALGSGNNSALMYDSLRETGREAEYHKYAGRNGAIWQIGFGIAAFIGGFIATESFSLALWLSTLMQFIAFVVSFFVREPLVTTKSELNPYAHLVESIQAFKRNPKLQLLLAADTLQDSVGEAAHQLTPAFIRTLWPLWAIGVISAVSNVVGALSYYLSEKVINKFKALKALVFGSAFNRVFGLAAFAYPTPFSPILLASRSVTYGVTQVSADTLSQKEFTNEQRATMGSLSSIVMSVGFAVASIAVGYLADVVGLRNILLIAEILLLPILFIYWKIFKHDRTQLKSI